MAVDVKPDPQALGENPLVEGLERLPVPATTLVIFGATGDLAHRKLLPALYNLAHEGALPERFNLIGVARREHVRRRVPRRGARVDRASSRAASPTTQVLDGLLERMRYVSAPVRRRAGYARLRRGDRRARRGGRRSRSTASTTSRPRRSSSR